MADRYLTPNKTAGIPLQPGGLYIGTVRQVSGNQVFVEIPSIAPRFAFGPCLVAGGRVTTTTTSSAGYVTTVTTTVQPPAIGDKVLCSFIENEKSELVVLGRILQ